MPISNALRVALSGTMGSPFEERRVVELAVDRGHLTRSKLEIRPSPESFDVRYGPLLDHLITNGVLSEQLVQSLIAEVAAADDTRSHGSTNETQGKSFGSVLDLLPAAFARWDRYEIKRSLGQGGMGIVYEAFDRKLARTVALKFVQRNGERATRRFLREARAQARVAHPNVCKVHDVGEFAAQPFVAMEYLRGKPLLQAAQQMSLEQKVQVVQTLAHALHAAHVQGIVHRDVKPGNVMVEMRDDGSFHPTIMDFGLARTNTDEEDLTASGAVLGTPAYMSPEQARGEHADRRTDIYGLGAVLYHLLVGKPPFDGPNVQHVLARVIRDDPVAPRKLSPAIPVDLEAIVAKCLCKVPSDRYETARALAEDLERHLFGEPIVAKQASWPRRLKSWVRKRRSALVVLMLVTMAITGGISLQIRGQREADRRAKLAQRLGGEVEALEMLLRTAYMRPLHDVREEEALLRARMEQMTRELVDFEGKEAALAHAALGRSHLALHEYEEARKNLEIAIEGEIDDSDTHAALGRTFGELYRQAREELEAEMTSAAPDDRFREIDAKWLIPAKQHLQKAIDKSAIPRHFEEALMALYSQRYDEAEEKARSALAERTWLYEAKRIIGDVYFSRGFEHKVRGDLESAAQNYTRADELYREASDMARSDAALHTAIAKVELERMGLAMLAGQSPIPAQEKAEQACHDASRADTRRTDAMDTLYRTYRTRAYFEMEHGRDPGPWLEKMVAAASDLQTRQPTKARPHQLLAQARALQLRYETSRGIFAAATRADMEKSAARALELEPTSVDAWMTMAHAHQIAASAGRLHDEDERSHLVAAIAAFERVIASSRTSADSAYASALLTYESLLRHEHRRGRPIDTIAQDAFQLMARALERSPRDRTFLRLRAQMRLTQAAATLDVGQIARDFLAEAQKDLLESSTGKPDEPSLHRLRASLHRLQAEVHFRQGADPLPEIALAVTEIESARRGDPHNSENDVESVKLQLARARYSKSEAERMDLAQLIRQEIEATIAKNPIAAFQIRRERAEVERLVGTSITATTR